MDLIRRHRQEHLARAAQFAESREDEPDHLLKAQVGIEAKPNIAMPDVAERHRQPQFAAPRLGASGVQHARTQHAQFELADAALHAQKQPVVRAAGVVDAILVDDAGLDQAAQLQQMVPVAAVAREPRGIEAQHGADLARAKPADQPVKARSGDRPAGRSAHIVVDDLDVA